MCVCGLSYNHMYPPKQTETSHDTSIRFYSHKRKLMAIFSVSYSLKGKFALWMGENPQKLCFCERDACVCVVRKNFLEVLSTHCVCLRTSLRSYLSPKANKNIARHFNQILQSQTWANGNIFDLMITLGLSILSQFKMILASFLGTPHRLRNQCAKMR